MSEINLKNANPIEVADELIHKMPRIIISKEMLYFYNGKHYEVLDDFIIGQHIFNMYVNNNPDKWNPNKSNAIIVALKYHPSIKRVEEMDDYDDYVNLNNCILKFSDRSTQPHSPDFYFTACISVDYDNSNTTAPFFTSLINGIFTNPDDTIDHDTVRNIIRIGGYLIYPKIKIHKMFIFFGTGSNGKSIIIEHIYKKFFDKKFMSSMSLNALSKEDNAARKQLLTARVNFATEQKASSDIESDELKKIINGEDISIRRMYQDTITHAPKCKIMVAENRFARFKDTSEGTRRRLFMINFPNRFEKDPVKYKKIKNPRQYRVFPALYEEDIIKNLNNELPAILNIFLDGLEELRKNHWNIIESKNSEDIFNEYIKESDYVGSWLEENFEKDDNEKESLSVKEVLNKYREWWLYHFPEKKFDMSTKLLGRRIKELFRIDSHQLVVRIGEDNITTTSVYYLKTKIDETWELIHNSQPTNDLKQMSF